MNWFRSRKTIVTHSGQFHADEVFSIALLLRLPEWKGSKIIRTRDEALFLKGDLVLDIGGIYDADKLRFDHHQLGGAGIRENGIPYASLGLIWRKFGVEICDGDKIAADLFERNLVFSIDSNDNGMEISKAIFPDVKQYALDDMIRSFYPSFKEDQNSEDTFFMSALNIARQIVDREIRKAKLISESVFYIENVYNQTTDDKRIIVLDEPYPWKEVILKHPEPLIVVTPNKLNGTWGVRTVPLNHGDLGCRFYLPKAWAGKRGEELAKITGVKDADFCHRVLFMAVAKSKEGAIQLAKLALETKN